jgi:hypothetical protein
MISGAIAGLLMALAAMIHFAAYAQRFSALFKLFAGVLFGFAAVDGGPWVVITGIFLHLLVSLLLGILFALIVGTRLSVALVFIIGVTFSIIVWAISTFLILPWANPLLYLTFVITTRYWWFFYHVIYGVGLILTARIHRYFLRSTPLVRRN